MKKVFSVLCGVFMACAFQASTTAQTITNQPQSVTVNNASTATFTVGASNALTYQWQFNGSNIAGETNSSLTLEDVMTNQEGNYAVVVNGSVTSSNAVLTIVPGTIVTFTFSGIIGGGPSNVNVQLFDHDKPATVENFMHYVTAGGYSNMFIERCEANFVIQGGIFGASNRTSTTPPITGWDIITRFTLATDLDPPFPHQVASEFNVGPLIHNRFGTIAMATGSNPNTANSSFFFNLVDNSADLDSQDFTVFGRILDGTNVLNYFNTLSTGNGVASSSEVLTNGVADTSQLLEPPVNYIGTNPPANANLVFCDITNITPFVIDTNPPTVSITNPAPNELFTNSLEGTASDNVGLAVVNVVLTPQAAADGNYPYPFTNAAPVTNYAVGTTNWSLSLNPGVYDLSVQSQDGAGNLSPAITELVTNTGVYIVGNGTVAFTNAALTNENPVGYPLQLNTNYGIQAIPGTNQTFVNWSDGYYTSTDPMVNYLYEGFTYVATFITNQSNGIAFTYPLAGGGLSNTLFNITGTISTNVLTLPVTVTCQIFTNATPNLAVTFPLSVTTSTTNWSVSVTNYLPTGSYFIQALATDKLGNNTLITENFSFTANTNPPSITITNPAPGALLYLGGPLLLQGTAGNDIVPLMSVSCTLAPVTNADGSAPNHGFSFTDPADGTTNWSLDLNSLGYIPPGSYMLSAQVQDEGSNTAVSASQLLTISAILINGNGSVVLTQGTNVTTNVIGYPFQNGSDYNLKAVAGAGQIFVKWSYKNTTEISPDLPNFPYAGGLLTATFMPSNTPRGSKGISFTYPAPNSVITTNNFLLRGKIVASVKSAQIACQISSLSTGVQVGPLLTTSGTNTWSIPVTDLPPDVYVIQAVATNAAGFSSVISEEFVYEAFKGVAGTYNGLFLCTNGAVSSLNSGFITLTVANSGAYSARLLFPAYAPVTTDYRFDANGSMDSPYQIFPSNPLHLTFSLDLTNGTDTITGTISSDFGTWSSAVVCYRAVTRLSAHTTPATGKYILSLDPPNWPNTNGYAAISVSSGGALALSGALPDGAAFSQSARVSTNGVWPLYVIPTGYKTNGVLMGWETNLESGGSSGELYWFKAPNVGEYYTNSVNTTVNSTGTNYSAPEAGSYSIVFQGATITVPVTNELTMPRAGGQFNPGKTTDKLAISLSAGGVLTGHFVNTNDDQTLQFKGAFFGQSRGGSGFILEKGGQTGYFLLQAQQ
jgi:peptidyl-prolyl cis-trans isomerase A (cyclophilin A)